MREWFVVRTHARAEEKALANLRRQGYGTYLPTHTKRRRHARHTDFVRAPLFPRYLFVSFDRLHERWRPILSTFGVCDLIRRSQQPSPVPASLIEELQENERLGAFDHQARLDRLAKGDFVRIATGPFADLVGQFCSMTSDQRVTVMLSLLGRSVRAQLPGSVVDPI